MSSSNSILNSLRSSEVIIVVGIIERVLKKGAIKVIFLNDSP
jgi:hypothetical protein